MHINIKECAFLSYCKPLERYMMFTQDKETCLLKSKLS